MRSYSRLLVVGGWLSALVPVVVATPGVAVAQSAADKATARTLAREGIDLFKAAKYADSLDKMQRAQELYDAPVHLVYIARCQDKLGLVVESTETYRRLVRLTLDDNAPEAFKQAVADAKKELPEVEPKVARVKILVEPANVEGLQLEIDGVKVSAAVVGVDRPANPGARKISASAPGYESAEASVDLTSGQTKTLKLVLEKDPSAGAPGASGAAAGGKEDPKGDAKDPAETPAGGIGFMLGARMGGGTTFGDLRKDDPIKDYYGPFFGVELRGGVRFARRYTAVLFGAGYAYQVGSKLNQFPVNNGSTADVTTTSGQGGVGFQYAPPPREDGIFGEIDLLFVQRFETKRDLSVQNTTGSLQESCQQTLVANGNGLRLSGGYQFGVSRLFQLTPFLGLTFAQVRDVSLDSDCSDGLTPADSGLRTTPWETDAGIPSGEQSVHGMVTVGIGGEFTFGSDNPSK
jgi:hypothetical protein